MNHVNHTSHTTRDSEHVQSILQSKASLRLWGLDWTASLRALDGVDDQVHKSAHDFQIQVCSYSEILKFLNENQFENKTLMNARNQNEQANPLLENEEFRVKYYNEFADCFLIRLRSNNQVIGIGINNVLDWQSYYMRYFILQPAFRGQGVFKNYTLSILKILSIHSVNRVEMDVAPSNSIQIHRINKIGFIMSGMTLSERWGSMLRFTHFLNQKYSSSFLNQFCQGKQSILTSDSF